MSSKNNTQFNWRPDFKIEATLPDIKVIRTDFAINAIILVLVLVTSTLLVQREYQSYLLRSSVAELEQQVNRNSAEDATRLQKSEEFREQALKIQELQQFFKVPFFAHESMIELAALKPQNVIFTRVKLSERTIKTGNSKKNKTRPEVMFEVNIEGNVQDLPVLTEFKRMLEESLLLNSEGFEVNVDESMEQRDVDTGIIPFQITMSFVVTSELNSNQK